MSYVGGGQGCYVQETTYRFVGEGGDFDLAPRRQNFTCVVAIGGCLVLLFLAAFFCWLLRADGYDCDADFHTWQLSWSDDKQRFCCAELGRGCQTTPLPPPPRPRPPPPPPMPPHTPPTTRRPPPTTIPPRGDPFNCAFGLEATWKVPKKVWCCKVHHKGCPYAAPTLNPNLPPADPYNCADGYANWVAGWSAGKKKWCCRVHGKGCPTQGGGCAPSTPAVTLPPFDCAAGWANWERGWSIPKKEWCCKNGGKGCKTGCK